MPRGLLDSVDPLRALLSEVNLVEVRGENLLLRVPDLHEERELGLPELAPQAFPRRQEEVLGKLLGDRRAALDEPHVAKIRVKRPGDADRVDACVGIETG